MKNKKANNNSNEKNEDNKLKKENGLVSSFNDVALNKCLTSDESTNNESYF